MFLRVQRLFFVTCVLLGLSCVGQAEADTPKLSRFLVDAPTSLPELGSGQARVHVLANDNIVVVGLEANSMAPVIWIHKEAWSATALDSAREYFAARFAPATNKRTSPSLLRRNSLGESLFVLTGASRWTCGMVASALTILPASLPQMIWSSYSLRESRCKRRELLVRSIDAPREEAKLRSGVRASIRGWEAEVLTDKSPLSHLFGVLLRDRRSSKCWMLLVEGGESLTPPKGCRRVEVDGLGIDIAGVSSTVSEDHIASVFEFAL